MKKGIQSNMNNVTEAIKYCLTEGKCTDCKFVKGKMFLTCRYLVEDMSKLLEEYKKGEWVPQQSNKEEPMKPDRYYFNKYLFKCRQCGKVLDILEHTYCPACGQKIDWSEYPADEPEIR